MMEPRRDSKASASAPFPWRAFFIALSLIALCGTTAIVQAILQRRTLPPATQSHLELRPAPNVLVAIQDLSRLEVVSYHMERVIELSDEQAHLWGLVNSRDTILLVAAADVIAGIDLRSLSSHDVAVDWPHRQIRLIAPSPQIFSLVLDNEHTHVYSRTTDALAERREDLETRARQEADRAMRQGAIESGILPRARPSAEHALRALLTGLGFEHIDIEFHEPAQSHQ
jgi:hypothetical protein